MVEYAPAPIAREPQQPRVELGEQIKRVMTPGISRAIAGSVVPGRFNPERKGSLQPDELPAITTLTPDKLAYSAAEQVSLESRKTDNPDYDTWGAGIRWLVYQKQVESIETGRTEGVDALRAVGLLDQDSPVDEPVVISKKTWDSFFKRYLNGKADIKQFVEDIAKGARDIDEVKARVEAVPGLLLSFGKTDSVDRLVGGLAIGREIVSDAVAKGEPEALVDVLDPQLQEEVVDPKEREYLAALDREQKKLASQRDEQPIHRTDHGDNHTPRRVDDLTDSVIDHTELDHRVDHHDNDSDTYEAKDLWERAHGKEELPDDIWDSPEASDLVSFDMAPNGLAVVYVLDPESHKVIRYDTGKPMPTDDEDRRAVTFQIRRDILANSDVQKLIKRAPDQAVDITRKKGHLVINSLDSEDNKTSIEYRVPILLEGTIDGVDILLNPLYVPPDGWTRAESETAKNKRVTVIGPGWSMGGLSRTAEDVATEAANRTGRLALALDTLPYKKEQERKDKGSLYREAELIAKFLKSEGLKQVDLAGHSQGGRKMFEVAYILQQKRKEAQNALASATTDDERRAAAEQLALIPQVVEIKPINIRGLAHQKPWRQLAARFSWDAVFKTPARAAVERIRYAVATKRKISEDPETWANRKAMLGNVSKATGSIAGGVALRVKELGLVGAYRRIKHEVQEMASVLPDSEFRNHLRELEGVRLNFIFGEKDRVSDIKAVIPGYRKGMSSEEMAKRLHEEYFPLIPVEDIHVTVATSLGGLHGHPIFAANEIFGRDAVDAVEAPADTQTVAAQ